VVLARQLVDAVQEPFDIDGNMVRATCHGFRDRYELGYELVTQPAAAVS